MYNKVILSVFITIGLSIQGMDSPYQKRSKRKSIHPFKNIQNPFKSKKADKSSLSLNINENSEQAPLALNIDEVIKPIVKQLCLCSDSSYKNVYDFCLVNKKMNNHRPSPEQIIRYFTEKRNVSTFDELSNIKAAFASFTQKEMLRLKTIALSRSRVFQPEDLRNPWYLEATYNGYDDCPHVTLLHMAIEDLNFRKTEFIIDKMKTNNLTIPSNSLGLLAGLKAQLEPTDIDCIDKKELQTFYDITQLLLENGAHPDNRLSVHFFTLLHKASLSDAKDLAQLLLQHGANPEEEYIERHNKKYMQSGNKEEPWRNNAFTLEAGEPKGWLKKMSQDIQENKKVIITKK